MSAPSGPGPTDPRRRALLDSLTAVAQDLVASELPLLDVKIATAAFEELVEAFRVFDPYRHVAKLTMFGSARTREDDPVYTLARDLAARMAAEGWMVVTGAGPGIMQAGIEGAGAEQSFGVNIKLPFESGANRYIAEDPKLVEMRYFFTRKLILVKESSAFAVLPGGFGTLDELFELLTLLQTGKAMPAPLVLVETDGGTYWHRLEEFLATEAMGDGYISEIDHALWQVVTTPDEALAVFHRFFANYRSMRYVGDLTVLRLNWLPSKAALRELTAEFGDLLVAGQIQPCSPFPPEINDDDDLEAPRISLRFDRARFARLHQLIERLGELEPV